MPQDKQSAPRVISVCMTRQRLVSVQLELLGEGAGRGRQAAHHYPGCQGHFCWQRADVRVPLAAGVMHVASCFEQMYDILHVRNPFTGIQANVGTTTACPMLRSERGRRRRRSVSAVQQSAGESFDSVSSIMTENDE